MKITFLLFLATASIGIAHAQDAACNDSAEYQVPAVVYQAPVIYNAPVVYQAPVTYQAPVYYGTSAGCAPGACGAPENTAFRSTVTYIGGRHVGYQVARCNYGSTVTYIGGHSRFH